MSAAEARPARGWVCAWEQGAARVRADAGGRGHSGPSCHPAGHGERARLRPLGLSAAACPTLALGTGGLRAPASALRGGRGRAAVARPHQLQWGPRERGLASPSRAGCAQMIFPRPGCPLFPHCPLTCPLMPHNLTSVLPRGEGILDLYPPTQVLERREGWRRRRRLGGLLLVLVVTGLGEREGRKGGGGWVGWGVTGREEPGQQASTTLLGGQAGSCSRRILGEETHT